MARESVTAGGEQALGPAGDIASAGAAFTVGYDPWLVAASIAIAVMAAFTGLRLASGLKDLDGALRRRQIAKAALTLGGGIWSMHFVGMLAVQLPVLVSYDALYTLGSVLISILIVGIGLSLMHVGERSWSRIVFAGTLTGLGIVVMHYVGMNAMGGACIVTYQVGGMVLSSAIAIGFSICAIRLAYGRRTLLQLCLGALVLGVTIAAMHYSAMAFTSFLPVAETWSLTTPEIDQGQLALITAVAAFLVCGLFLLTALPLDGRSAQAGGAGVLPAAGPLPAAMPQAHPGLAAAARREPEPPPPAPDTVDPTATGRVRLPYEQNNATLFIDAGRVQAVQADGHYTRLIDGTGRHFCPWSLSKVEAHLAGGPFIRTHRSFLVNLDHARGLRRDRDKAFLMLPALSDAPVPVSRSHLADVRRALGL
ncbi:MAG: MHYT domain-containing protein [Sneathiellaceae bacterium]